MSTPGSITLRGIKYDSVEAIAQKYGYSIHHIRFLARLGREGKKNGLTGKKIGRRWWLNADKAERILVRANTEATETTDGEGTNDATLDFSVIDDL